jgi:hypothetical protein
LETLAETGDVSQLRQQFGGAGVDSVVGSQPLTEDNPKADATLNLDAALHRYFSFAAMVLPSNDAFYGNDDPMQFEVFDAQGNFQEINIIFTKSEWWDAGTEVNDKSVAGGAAFIMDADATAGMDESGIITGPAELSFYNGAILENGQPFSTLPQATDEFMPMVQVTVTLVPEPSAFAIFAVGLFVVTGVRFRK